MECRDLNEVECLKHKKYCRYTTGKRKYCRKLKNKTKKVSPKMSTSKSPSPKSPSPKSPSPKSLTPKTPTITETDEYIIVKNGNLSKKPHAVFDLDYTLIKTKSGRKFPKDGDDWVYLYDNTREILLEMSWTYNIILFTNQKGIRKAEKRVEFMRKVDQIMKDLGIRMHIYISIQDGYYRKPFTGLWELFVNNKLIPDKTFYCGDAAGRKEDFAATDLMFAHNIGIPFYLPEQLFLKQDILVDYELPDYLTQYIGTPPKINKPNGEKNMILMCGYPGSGKSSFAKQFGYLIASNDDSGTASKCKKLVTNTLKSGINIVVDNTHSTVKSRKEYYDLGKKYDYHVSIVYVDNVIQFCYYMNQLRCQLSKGDEELVPKIAYYTMRKRFVVPIGCECDTLITVTNKVAEYVYMFPEL